MGMTFDEATERHRKARENISFTRAAKQRAISNLESAQRETSEANEAHERARRELIEAVNALKPLLDADVAGQCGRPGPNTIKGAA